VESGQLGLFKNGYWDNPAYKLPPEADLMAVTHYLEALDLQKEIVKVHTIFGGKNPHPNWLVGGVPCPINVHSTGAVGAINMERLNHVASILQQCHEFTRNVYIPDVIAIGGFYRDWLHGGGLSSARPCWPMAISRSTPTTSIPRSCTCPRVPSSTGTSTRPRGRCARPRADPGIRRPFVVRIRRAGRGQAPLGRRHAGRFELGPNTVGERARISARSTRRRSIRGSRPPAGAATRWRWDRWPATSWATRKGHERITDQVTGLLTTMDLPVEALFSTLGRTAARALETEYCADLQQYFFDKLMTNIRNGDESTANIEKWEPQTWPASTRGVGFTEAPRGALGHWVTIEEGRIENYQCVVPTTWNGSPRDSAGNIGAFEASLLNTPMERPEEPVEILRTLHSFDPCLACSTHVMSPDGDELTTVKVR
jgi:hydrogenase large subunit